VGATGRTATINASAASGISVVATAIPVKRQSPYTATPTGAPKA
jgi:hypothetical protein